MQIYSDLYQNYAEFTNWKWPELLNMAKNPPTYISKAEIPLWSFYSYKEDAELLQGGVRAIGDSMESLLVIMVDYDDGDVKMCELDSMFNFQFLAYSSPGSTVEKEKLRVLIPLAAPLPNKWLKCKKIREYLMEMFPHCDTTTFDYFRRQRMPSKLETTNYSMITSDKKRIALDHLKMENMYNEWLVLREQQIEAKKNRKTITTGNVFDKSIEQLEHESFIANLFNKYGSELGELDMENRGTGVVHYTLRRIIYSLKMNDIEEEAIIKFLSEFVEITGEVEDLLASECS